MLDFLKRLFRKSPPSDDEAQAAFERDYELKRAGLETLLGPMHDLVGHAIIPFQVGGAVDMYYFPDSGAGTAFATMELIEPDGSGPMPSRLGTYELVSFTKLRIGDETVKERFDAIERRLCGLMTTIGFYSFEAVLNPRDTCEVPVKEGEPNRCVVFDEYTRDGIGLQVGDRQHGLLLCIEVFRREMEHAMEHGSDSLIQRLEQAGHYPFSDLDREPVV